MDDDFYKEAEEETLIETRLDKSYLSLNESEKEEIINQLYDEFSQKLTQIANFVESDEYLSRSHEDFKDLKDDLNKCINFMIKYSKITKNGALKDFVVFSLFQRIRSNIQDYNQCNFYKFDSYFMHYLNKEELEQCFNEEYFHKTIHYLNDIMNHFVDELIKENIYYILKIFITVCNKSMEITRNFLIEEFCESYFKVFDYIFKCNMKDEDKGEIIEIWLFLLGDLLAYDEEFTHLIENPDIIKAILDVSFKFPNTFTPFCYTFVRGLLLEDERFKPIFFELINTSLDTIANIALNSLNSKERLSAVYCIDNITQKYPEIALHTGIYSYKVVSDILDDEILCYINISINLVNTNNIEYLPIIYQSSLFQYFFETSQSKQYKIKTQFARLISLTLKQMNNDMLEEFLDHFDHDQIYSYLLFLLDPNNDNCFYISSVLAFYSLFEFGNSFQCKNGRQFLEEMLNTEVANALQDLIENAEITSGELPNKIEEMLSFE